MSKGTWLDDLPDDLRQVALVLLSSRRSASTVRIKIYRIWHAHRLTFADSGRGWRDWAPQDLCAIARRRRWRPGTFDQFVRDLRHAYAAAWIAGLFEVPRNPAEDLWRRRPLTTASR